MSQVSVQPVTACGRSPRPVLRPLLVVGGFVAIWWALMTGVAHAETAPHHGLVDQVRSEAKAVHHAAPVRTAVRRAHHDVKTATTKAAPHARHRAAQVSHQVAEVVDSTPVASKTTSTVRETVRTTVRTTVTKTREVTRDVLAETVAEPVVDAIENTVENTATDTAAETVTAAIEKVESSTQQRDSRPQRPSVKTPGAIAVAPVAVELEQLPQTSAAPGKAQASTDAGTPLDGPSGAPTVHDPCASPSGSGSSSYTPAGTLESSLLVMPAVLRDHHAWRLARQPGGPAYQPGSSPD